MDVAINTTNSVETKNTYECTRTRFHFKFQVKIPDRNCPAMTENGYYCTNQEKQWRCMCRILENHLNEECVLFSKSLQEYRRENKARVT